MVDATGQFLNPTYYMLQDEKVYVKEEVVEVVRDYLFEEGYIVNPELDIPNGYALYNDLLLPIIDSSFAAKYPYQSLPK